METKHNPGPWETYGSGALQHIRTVEGKDLIASDVTRDDARLIAAAPDLFEACQVAVNELENHTHVPGVSEHVLPCIRAALSKAGA